MPKQVIYWPNLVISGAVYNIQFSNVV